MNELQDKKVAHNQGDDAREISKWARRYTRSRTIPFLISQAFFVFFTIAIGVSSYLAALAYRAGRMLWFWICIVLLVSTLAALIWYIIRADRLIRSISKRLYLKEGSAILDTSLTKKEMLLRAVVISVFLFCVAASTLIGPFASLPQRYMQPVSAIYVVPFLVSMSILHRRRISLLSLLWPFLYALHAILVVAGAPILFKGPWFILNMFVPVVGYGMVTGLVGHIYNRFALRKLKKLAKVPPEDASHGRENIE